MLLPHHVSFLIYMPELSLVIFSNIVFTRLVSCDLKMITRPISINKDQNNFHPHRSPSHRAGCPWSSFLIETPSISFGTTVSLSYVFSFLHIQASLPLIVFTSGCPYIWIDKNAGTITIRSTVESIINIGNKSLVPASSPLFFAAALRSSNAWSASARSSSDKPLLPFRRFCVSNAANFRYAFNPHLFPNCSIRLQLCYSTLHLVACLLHFFISKIRIPR